jgi:8-oxo-dGTP pyrophosphatase MutT (NUDIX family)
VLKASTTWNVHAESQSGRSGVVTIVHMRSLADRLRRRLAEPLPGFDAQARMAPSPPVWPDAGTALRPAAALLLIYPVEDEWHIPLTVRSSGLRQHSGQVSLPGGRLDRPDESVEQAARREAQEEIGVAPADVDVLGRLTPLPIAVSGHLLHPVVGVAPRRPGFTLAVDEVERLIELPISRLLKPDAIAWEERVRTLPPHGLMNVPYFEIGGARVWGATAMVLAEFIAVVEEVLRPPGVSAARPPRRG